MIDQYLTQVVQSPVEEVADTLEHDERRRRLHACSPLRHRLRRDDLVGIALDHEPRRARMMQFTEVIELHRCATVTSCATSVAARRARRCNRRRRNRRARSGPAGAARAPTTQPPAGPRLAIAVVEVTSARADAAEVKAHGAQAQFAESSCKRVHHLVVHVPPCCGCGWQITAVAGTASSSAGQAAIASSAPVGPGNRNVWPQGKPAGALATGLCIGMAMVRGSNQINKTNT